MSDVTLPVIRSQVLMGPRSRAALYRTALIEPPPFPVGSVQNWVSSMPRCHDKRFIVLVPNLKMLILPPSADRGGCYRLAYLSFYVVATFWMPGSNHYLLLNKLSYLAPLLFVLFHRTGTRCLPSMGRTDSLEGQTSFPDIPMDQPEASYAPIFPPSFGSKRFSMVPVLHVFTSTSPCVRRPEVVPSRNGLRMRLSSYARRRRQWKTPFPVPQVHCLPQSARSFRPAFRLS